MIKNTTAIILAAGKSTRMGEDRPPKILAEVNHKPLITYLLDTLNKLGIDYPFVVVSHRQELVREALKNYPVIFVDQGEPKGTGHAVLAAIPNLSEDKFDRVFLCYGDTPFFSESTFKTLYQALDDPSVFCSLVTTQKTPQNEHFGRIIRHSKGELADIIEYKDATNQQREITEVNAGCYCVRVDCLKKELERIKPSAVTGEYYLTDLVKLALSNGQRVVPVLAAIDEAHGIDTPAILEYVTSIRGGEK